jgi:hypothetical protein
MGFLDKFSDKLSKDISTFSIPSECQLYFNYVEQYLEGFEFKDNILNTTIKMLKDDYNFYMRNKDSRDFINETGKYDIYTYLKDFIKKKDSFECAKAFAVLHLYDVLNHVSYSSYGKAPYILQEYLHQQIKTLDKSRIPETFFIHHNADEMFEKEERDEKNLTQKYLSLYDEYLKLKKRLEKYEDVY